MTGSSVNFQPVRSATHAVSHASRVVSPSYLLPPESSFGTVVVLDDAGAVASTLESKMALASRQARAVKGYSPVWEGVLNLRRPEAGEDANEYRNECALVTKEWCKKYEQMSGHKVLRVDVHLDEGHIEDGKAILNAHAHVIADRTDEHGRVKRLLSPDLRKLQTLTAKVTGLQRGENSLVSKKKHIGHQAYKYLAERGALQTQQAVEKEKSTTTLYAGLIDAQSENSKADRKQIKDLKAELADLKKQYSADRAALVASGQATQKDYQALKLAHEKAVADLKAEKAKTKELTAQVKAVQAENTGLATALVAAETENAQMTKTLNTATERDHQLVAEITALRAENATAVATAEHLAAINKVLVDQARERLANAQEAATRPEILSSKPLPSAEPKTATATPAEPARVEARIEKNEAPQLSVADHFRQLVDWIKSIGGTHKEIPAGSRSQWFGIVVKVDDVFAVQNVSRKEHVIHQVKDLTGDLTEGAKTWVKYDAHGKAKVSIEQGRGGRV